MSRRVGAGQSDQDSPDSRRLHRSPVGNAGKSVRASVDPATGEGVFLVEDAGSGECVAVSGRAAAAHPYAAITDSLNFTFPFDARHDRAGALLKRFTATDGKMA